MKLNFHAHGTKVSCRGNCLYDVRKNREGKMAIEKEIGECLRARHLTMGTAESCTGGYIAHLITRVAGSSDYFCGGVVSYSNEVKHHVLGVSEESLAQYGAVSRPVVEQMALGAIRVLGCDLSLIHI